MKLSAFGVFRMFMKKSKSKVVKLDDALKVVENFLNAANRVLKNQRNETSRALINERVWTCRMLLANLQMLKDENEIE
jgi:superfamily I DNA/RNA helicase